MRSSVHWSLETDPHFELWDQVVWAIGRWLCQQRARVDLGPRDVHIGNPAVHNTPCDWCYDEAFEVTHTSGLLKLLHAYGSAAYISGRAGLSEKEAARRALQQMVERASQVEGATELLANICGSDWWQSSLERDEMRLLSDDEDKNDTSDG